MLNLPIAMLQYLLSLAVIIVAQTAQPAISSPLPGQELRGQIEILGTADAPGFSAAELSFAFGASDSAEAWFPIQKIAQPATNASLALWDTTLLTDGTYVLRLRVSLQDGTFQDVFVNDLRIVNDVPLPTTSPTLTASATVTPSRDLPTLTPAPPTATPIFPTPLPLPTNPAEVTTQNIRSTFGRGAAIALVLFFVFFLLLRFRRN